MTTDANVVAPEGYQRIVYPERAEYLPDSVFQGYRIFLDHWSDITNYLQDAYEVLTVRRFSKALIIYGSQGCGKSVLAGKLHGDFMASKNRSMAEPASFESNNIWHRIVAGPSSQSQSRNIASATANSVVIQAENKNSWTQDAAAVVAGNKDRHCIVLADNCERDYFLQGLLGVSDDVYLATGRTDAALKAAAHRFVELCRTTLRGCLFIFFTNDEELALAFDHYVNGQHQGLVTIRDLKMPDDLQKEAIVRINVSRLNPFSYWFCVDRAGPEEKRTLWRTLKGADTFPASFAAVDKAIRSSAKNREGKPARKCVLNAFVLCSAANAGTTLTSSPVLSGDVDDVYIGTSFAIRQYKTSWHPLFGSGRTQRMLESEWILKIIVASDTAIAALLAGSPLAKDLIDKATVYHSPGTWTTTKAAHDASLTQLDSDLCSAFDGETNAPFWAKGSVRNHEYELQLKKLYPTYNTKGSGFLKARPDLVIADYTPCSILRSLDDDQANINAALRREANVVEFTAIREFSMDKLVAYLIDQKLPNYVNAVQEQ